MKFFTILPKDGWVKGMFQAIILGLFVQSVFGATMAQYVDPMLKPYYDDYMFITKTHCRPDQYLSTDNYFISIEDIKQDPGYVKGQDPKTIGECYDTPPYKFIIHVDKEYFETHSPIRIKSVMFHEMRHCIFGLGNKDHSKEINNYFAATLPDYTDEEELYNQVISDIKKSCGSP